MSKYLDSKVAEETLSIATRVYHLLDLAINPEVSLARLQGVKNGEARIVNKQGFAVVNLANFDRSDQDRRRAERSFRTRLLPGVLSMVSPDFTIDNDALLVPRNFNVLASLVTPSREIEVFRTLFSTVVPDDDVITPDFGIIDNNVPGIVGYTLSVANLNRLTS